MAISRQTLDRLLQMCETPPRYGEWKEFCQREGVHYQTLHYWREKLRLRRLPYPKRKIMNVSVTVIVK